MGFLALNRHHGHRATSRTNANRIARNPFFTRLGIEPLEDRRLLSLGDLLQSWTDPSTNPQTGCLFGYSVAADGNLAVVGAPYTSAQGFAATGIAYVFNTSTHALVATLANPAPENMVRFGSTVAISGSNVIVGAPGVDTAAADAGAAYIFDAATGNLLRTLANPMPAESDDFGMSVAISGNAAVVGAPNDDTGATDSGAAYIYDAAKGSLLRTLVNPSPATGDYFGMSVAISGYTVVAGTPYDDTGATDSGAAYTYDATNGSLLRTLVNPSPAAGDHFGMSVAIAGSIAAVGAPYDDSGATDSGTAYTYDAAAGSLLRTFVNPTPAASDYFGYGICISGSTLVIGALRDDTGATDAGSAYTFNATTGELLHTLANPTPAAGDFFGYSAAISGNVVTVGAVQDDSSATDAGAAYVFDAATGNLSSTLVPPPTPAAFDVFGYSVDVSNNFVVVGARGDDTGAPNAGTAYIYDSTTGSLLRRLINPAPETGDSFGSSVAIDGSIVVIGADGDHIGGLNAGAAYIFDATTGNLLRTLANPTPGAYDSFGSSVAVYGNRVVVGAWQDSQKDICDGAVYIFDTATGSLLHTLADPTPIGDGYFGSSVAILGNTVVVGARGTGTAYVFDANSGNLLRTLINPNPEHSYDFGCSAAIDGNTILVGAQRDDTIAYECGVACIFDAVTGNLLRTLANPTPAESDYFGSSVAVSGNTVVVGASHDDTGAFDAGAAYVFDATTGDLLVTLGSPSPAAGFGASVAIAAHTAVVGTPGYDGSSASRGAAYLFDVSRTCTWDGGSTVNNLWTTKENWGDDVAPSAGDNLVFPAGAVQLENNNDYAAVTVFGSVTISGSGYHFGGNIYQSPTVVVQPSASVEVTSVCAGTLTLGAGSTLTITAIPGGPQATSGTRNAAASPVASMVAPQTALEVISTQAAASDTESAAAEAPIDAAAPLAVDSAGDTAEPATLIEAAPATLNAVLTVESVEAASYVPIAAAGSPSIARAAANSTSALVADFGSARAVPQTATFATIDSAALPGFVNHLMQNSSIGTIADQIAASVSAAPRSAFSDRASLVAKRRYLPDSTSQAAHFAALSAVLQNRVSSNADGTDLAFSRHCRSGLNGGELEKLIDAVVGEDADLLLAVG
jgi:hypothetical protein